MKKLTKIIVTVMSGICCLSVTPIDVLAIGVHDCCSGSGKNIRSLSSGLSVQQIKNEIREIRVEQIELSNDMTEEVVPDLDQNNSRMEQSMRQKQAELNSYIDQSKKENKELVSFQEILSSDSQEYNLSEADMLFIKNNIIRMAAKDKSIDLNGERLGGILDYQVPKELVKIDKDYDGEVTDGGWPGCVDTNGWGYKNFIGSDCFYALAIIGFCMTDLVGHGKSGVFRNFRYCQYGKRNCSHLIGHSKYNHSH